VIIESIVYPIQNGMSSFRSLDAGESSNIESNTATKDGGGIFALAPINFTSSENGSITTMKNNSALSGGGLGAFSQNGLITIYSGHSVRMENNYAMLDGGGMALKSGASLEVSTNPCLPECLANMRGNGKCDPLCYSIECGW